MDKQDIKDYITLQEATQYCQYSQEYLSLRARSGKLKAVKFGRNWTTKKEWLNEYLATVEEYKEYVEECRIKKETKNSGVEIIQAIKKEIPAPENLPVEELGFFGKIKEAIFNFPSPEFFGNGLRFGFSACFASVLIIAGCVFGNSSLTNVFFQANSCVAIVSEAGNIVVAEFVNSSADGLADVVDSAAGFAISTGKTGDVVINRASGISRDLMFAVLDGIGAAAEKLGNAEFAAANSVLNYSRDNIAAVAEYAQEFVANVNESGDIVARGIVKIPADSILAAGQDIQTGVENINYGGEKVLDSFVIGTVKEGADVYSTGFSAINNFANDIGNSSDSLMAASVENFRNGFERVSALTYIVGGAGDEFMIGSLAGAKDLSWQTSKIASFAFNNAKRGKEALALQASIFTDYTHWALNSLKNKVFSFGNSVKVFAGNFQQRSGDALYSLKEGAVQGFDNLIFAVSEKAKNIFAFMGRRTGASAGQVAVTEGASPVVSQDKQGMVVLPVQGDEEKTKEKIKSFFSDEVEVAPRDADSGIITPVFKEKKGPGYMYMMVPINNKN